MLGHGSPIPTCWSGGARDFGNVAPPNTGLMPWPLYRPDISYYASSQAAHARSSVSRRSTIDLRETVLDGGILLVSTAQGSVGRDVSALVGASLLNLVDSVIREQESLSLHQRRAHWL